MKALMIYPPQWNPSSPHSALPLLKGQLIKSGYKDVVIKDFNNIFFRHILESGHLKNCISFTRGEFERLNEEVLSEYPDREKSFDTYDSETKTKLLRWDRMNKVFSFGEDRLKKTVDGIDGAVNILRSKVDFYNPEKLFPAKILIQDALKIASLPYYPNEMIWDNYFYNPALNLDWENIDYQIRNEKTNMFSSFFRKILSGMNVQQYDLVAIAVPDLSQILAAFTIALMLRENGAKHISMGGNYLTQDEKAFLNHPEVFSDYVDDIIVGDGEKALPELFSYLDGKITREKVSGLMYFKGGKVVENEAAPEFKIEDTAYSDFEDYDFSDYFTPEPVLPVQLSKGCYWGKCAFCDYFYGQQCFDIKSPARAAAEFGYYVKKYGVHNFVIVDEAVPPKYYSELADEIIKSGIEIYFYSFARLDKGFTEEVFKKIYKAGARMLMWGYEASSDRILKKMNKGEEIAGRMDILRDAHNAGIWNNCLFMIGYPTETREEVDKTLGIIHDNRDIINSSTPSNFSLKRNSRLMFTMEDIISYKENGEFYTVLKDKIDGISQAERRSIRRKFNEDMQREFSDCMWPVIYSEMDHVTLYLAHYGLEYVSEYRAKQDICPKFN